MVALATFAYPPPSAAPGAGLRIFLMSAGVPLATPSGLSLWQQARVHRWGGAVAGTRAGVRDGGR
ncbi:hypothetical protein BJF78_03910 [Pseudonocardia sp. CNS-139]|nr:hypothetical protein BJF78_03910 [Pseudonocardia sp. CNS-139]